ncbi:prepilin peptidase [Pseudoduganella eburnea]|uniref:Prepilin peptidase n=1 Tax=Massilia eburnea TaxID=1776165 RepID=A0A6L6QNV0_9BURK|nr:prepilin peptidase [Massilia eburnea]MTW14098.1 prepilin peptidase [Massilia eburnea]
MSGLEIILLCLVFQAAASDLAWRRVPNVLVLTGMLLALALHWRLGGAGALLAQGLAGASIGLLLFLPLYALGGMAGGDVKLLAMAGSFVGPWQALQVALLSAMAGGVLALVCLQLARWRGGKADGMPYAVAIAAGTIASVALAHR